MGDVLTYIINNRAALALLISCLSLFVAGLALLLRYYDIRDRRKRGVRLSVTRAYGGGAGEEGVLVKAVSTGNQPIVVERIAIALEHKDIFLEPDRGSRYGIPLGHNQSTKAFITLEDLRYEVAKFGRARLIYAEDGDSERYKFVVHQQSGGPGRRLSLFLSGLLAHLPARFLPGLLLPGFLQNGIHAKRPWRPRDRRPRLEPAEVLLGIKSVDEYKRQIADHFAPLVDAERLSVRQTEPESPEEAEGLRRLLSDRMYLLTLDKDILADKGKIDKACASKASAHPDRADRIKAEGIAWANSYEELRRVITKELMPALEEERKRLRKYTQPPLPAANAEQEATEVDKPADPDNPPTGAPHET